MSVAAMIPTLAPRSKRRRVKWLIALAATAALGGLVYVIAGVKGALDEGPQKRAVTCSKAMSALGWKLPENARDQQCTKLTSLMGSTQSGTFRMPHAEARPWLASLPGDRSRPAGGAGPDGVAEREEGLTLSIHAQGDPVRVNVRWEGQDTAVVTFETFDY
ncbi:hypothetical protein ABZ769_26670 [Streptomyces olivoreticuli]